MVWQSSKHSRTIELEVSTIIVLFDSLIRSTHCNLFGTLFITNSLFCRGSRRLYRGTRGETGSGSIAQNFNPTVVRSRISRNLLEFSITAITYPEFHFESFVVLYIFLTSATNMDYFVCKSNRFVTCTIVLGVGVCEKGQKFTKCVSLLHRKTHMLHVTCTISWPKI